jgi:lysyl-tRNA synthetase class 1
MIIDIKRAYELANDGKVPEKIGIQIPYLLMAIIDQIVPEGPSKLSEAIKRLQRTGHIQSNLTSNDLKIIEKMLSKSGYWARKYAPESYRITILSSVPQNIKSKLNAEQIAFLKELYPMLKTWTESDYLKLESALYSLIRQVNIKSQDAYKALYMILLGKPNGPRLASFMLAVGLDKVLKLINDVIEIS